MPLKTFFEVEYDRSSREGKLSLVISNEINPESQLMNYAKELRLFANIQQSAFTARSLTFRPGNVKRTMEGGWDITKKIELMGK